MAGMGYKNRMVIVKEKLVSEYCDPWGCRVYGLDNDEREAFYKLLVDVGDENTEFYPNTSQLIVVCRIRASELGPLLEKLDYEFYNVSDNADTVTNDNVVVTWRFMKKI